jgi:histidinol-phosphate aminotransferase
MGLTVIPSASISFSFQDSILPSAELWLAILDKGVLIRDVGLLGYLRVTIGNEAENNKFISSLAACLGEK